MTGTRKDLFVSVFRTFVNDQTSALKSTYQNVMSKHSDDHVGLCGEFHFNVENSTLYMTVARTTLVVVDKDRTIIIEYNELSIYFLFVQMHCKEIHPLFSPINGFFCCNLCIIEI